MIVVCSECGDRPLVCQCPASVRRKSVLIPLAEWKRRVARVAQS